MDVATDIYYTIEASAQGIFKDKGSKFIAFAYPVSDVQQAEQHIAQLRKEYHDARHVCYAYRIDKQGITHRSFDDGEPSGTAGKPIFGQLLSADLTNVLVAVVRYFGGTLLGTSGLINAYKTAAKEALNDAKKVEKFWTSTMKIAFDAADTNKVMHIVKTENLQIVSQNFEQDYQIVLNVRDGRWKTVKEQFATFCQIVANQ
ncbi:hypothetical protein FACS189467_3750 [Bacteroidia bacterium]|nr:hypothetical protein FACS189467_3750 [Bacteroidia bacterium]